MTRQTPHCLLPHSTEDAGDGGRARTGSAHRGTCAPRAPPASETLTRGCNPRPRPDAATDEPCFRRERQAGREFTKQEASLARADRRCTRENSAMPEHTPRIPIRAGIVLDQHYPMQPHVLVQPHVAAPETHPWKRSRTAWCRALWRTHPWKRSYSASVAQARSETAGAAGARGLLRCWSIGFQALAGQLQAPEPALVDLAR